MLWAYVCVCVLWYHCRQIFGNTIHSSTKIRFSCLVVFIFFLAKFHLPSCNLQSVAILLHFVVILKCFGFVVGVLSQLLFLRTQNITYNYYSYRYSLKKCMRLISMDDGNLSASSHEYMWISISCEEFITYIISASSKVCTIKKINKCNLIGIYFKNFDLHCFANLNKPLK